MYYVVHLFLTSFSILNYVSLLTDLWCQVRVVPSQLCLDALAMLTSQQTLTGPIMSS